MVYYVDKLDFNYQKYQTNGTVKYEVYKEKFLFTMKEFMLFGKYHQ